MESSLHRDLKNWYTQDDAQQEVRLDEYRIDVVRNAQLIEIQHGSLSAIRQKVARLLKQHEVLVVKPIVHRKRLIKRARKNGQVQSRRLSPKRGQLLELFDELIYFRHIFPHPRLTLEVPMVDIEEWRYPGHGRRRRRRERDHVIEDAKLLEVIDVHRFATSADLRRLLPAELPQPFTTADLAEGADVDRATAQRIAYCLRHTGTAQQVGKQGNAWLYHWTPAAESLGPRSPSGVRAVA